VEAGDAAALDDRSVTRKASPYSAFFTSPHRRRRPAGVRAEHVERIERRPGPPAEKTLHVARTDRSLRGGVAARRVLRVGRFEVEATELERAAASPRAQPRRSRADPDRHVCCPSSIVPGARHEAEGRVTSRGACGAGRPRSPQVDAIETVREPVRVTVSTCAERVERRLVLDPHRTACASGTSVRPREGARRAPATARACSVLFARTMPFACVGARRRGAPDRDGASPRTRARAIR
jgi:hypothetical protein